MASGNSHPVEDVCDEPVVGRGRCCRRVSGLWDGRHTAFDLQKDARHTWRRRGV